MPTKNNNIIKCNQGEKSVKLPFVVYADLECLLEKTSTCQNNPNESSTTEINKHTPSGYSIFTHCSFDQTKNKLDHYRGKDCMKKFSKDLREHATKIINYEKKRMILLTTEEKIYHNEQEICYICKKEFDEKNYKVRDHCHYTGKYRGAAHNMCNLREHATKIINYEKKRMILLTTEEKIYHNEQEICYICKKEFDEKNYKVRDHCHYTGKYRGAAHNMCNLRYKIPKEIPAVVHNGSTYDYHFIIKELVKEFNGNFECLGENTEKYITFSAPIKKKIKNKNIEITYKIKFIDSYRFMAMSLSKRIDNLSEGIYNNKCADCKSCLDYVRSTKHEKVNF